MLFFVALASALYLELYCIARTSILVRARKIWNGGVGGGEGGAVVALFFAIRNFFVVGVGKNLEFRTTRSMYTIGSILLMGVSAAKAQGRGAN